MDVFPIAYAAPVSYYVQLLQSDNVFFEVEEFFPKQTIRNHCNILTSHGTMKLSIPLESRRNKTLTKEIKISYTEDWQKHHWRSIVTAYSNSAFFEFYAHKFEKIYHSKIEYLVDFNQAMLEEITSILKRKISYQYSSEYLTPITGVDYRDFNFSNIATQPYYQLFGDSKFIHGLSIYDLIFNEGNRSIAYLISNA